MEQRNSNGVTWLQISDCGKPYVEKETSGLNVYKNIMDAHDDIANDIKQGKVLKFYGLRGATFIGSSEVNAIVRELKSNRQLEIKF